MTASPAAAAAASTPPAVTALITVLTDVATGAEHTTTQEQVAAVRPALEATLRDPGTAALFAGRDRSFLVWSGPVGVTLHASVHRPGHVTPPHDHGPAWAVYGVVAGPTLFARFTRGTDSAPGVADLRPAGEFPLAPGRSEVVWPGEVHSVANRGDRLSWNLVVRSRALDEVRRHVFDAQTGSYRST